MHAVLTNQIADILHFSDKDEYTINCRSLIHSFFYKNTLYKNIEAQNVPKK